MLKLPRRSASLKRSMFAFYKTTIGKKYIAALSGLVLFLFVVGHMAGNLKTFAGSEGGVAKLDLYAKFLREMGAHVMGHMTALWIVRLVLLTAVVLHVVTVVQLTARNRAARPQGYRKYHYNASTLGARLMWWGGVLLGLFIVYHILHMTLGVVHFAGFVEGQVYANVYSAFRIPYVTAIYVVGMCCLGLHLYHGTWSLFQTLGIDSPANNVYLRRFAALAATVVAIGFVLVPLAVAFGFLPQPPAGLTRSY